jgi:uncharacterized membrane-anchored protein YitT (DUF2179 family)
MAAGVNLIYEPMNMVVGGVSGLAIVVKRVTEPVVPGGVPVWLTTAIVNIPLFLAALKVKGKDFVRKTLFATVIFTLALYILPSYDIIHQDSLLAALAGGILTGAGLGLVFRNGGSTGGTDLLGAILNYFFPYYSVANMLLVVDSTIIVLGAFIFGINSALYAVIAVYVSTKILDNMLEGMKFAKLAYIISDEPEKIARHILEVIDRGVTIIEAQGGYSKEAKQMVMCVVSNKQIVKLKECVADIAPESFLIISDAREVLGEGFIEIDY